MMRLPCGNKRATSGEEEVVGVRSRQYWCSPKYDDVGTWQRWHFKVRFHRGQSSGSPVRCWVSIRFCCLEQTERSRFEYCHQKSSTDKGSWAAGRNQLLCVEARWPHYLSNSFTRTHHFTFINKCNFFPWALDIFIYCTTVVFGPI